MRVAFFNDTYRPYISGAIRSVEIFSASLRERGHEVYIVAPGRPYSRHHDDYLCELPSISVPGIKGMRVGTPLLADGHFALRQDLEVDIVHTHSPFVVGQIGARYARSRRLPLVFTCHSLYPEYSEQLPVLTHLAEDLIREYVLRYCKECNIVLAPSEHVRQTLQGWGVVCDIKVVPTGIDVAGLNPDGGEHVRGKRRELGLSEDDHMLLFVGRLDRQKRIDLLIRALAQLEDSTHLVLVGDGPHRSRLTRLAYDKGLHRRVHCVGAKPFEQVRRYYHAADIFCFSSEVETQGLVLLEAMAAGLPVVSVDCPAAREVVSRPSEGLLVKPNPSAIARGIRLLMQEEELRSRLKEEGRLRAEQFSADKQVDRLLDVYAGLIS